MRRAVLLFASLMIVACGDDDRPGRLDGGGGTDAFVRRCETTTDTDGDGLYDDYEGTGDFDGDGTPDFMDLDSDNDGIPDSVERGDRMGCEARNTDGDAFPDHLDNDSDNDGLGDREETEVYSTDPLLEDSDGDGFSDAAEVATMSDPRDPESGIDPDDFYVVLPFGGPEQVRTLRFGTTLRKADVFFVVDRTGSMSEEIRNLRSGLSGLVDSIVTLIPDVGVGVGGFAGFGNLPPCMTIIGGLEACADGPPGDLPFELESVIVTDRTAMQAAVDGLNADMGGANWASSTEALYQTATGEGVSWGSESNQMVPPQTCARVPDEPGVRFGYPCFRPGALPIIIPITDTSSKNGPGTSSSQDYDSPIPHTVDQTRLALAGIGARVFGVVSGQEIDSPTAEAQMRDWAMNTGTVDGSGAPIMFRINSDGSGLTDRVAEAINRLATETPQDITTRTQDGDDLPVQDPPVDATLMIKEITPVAAYDPAGIEIGPDVLSRDDRAFYGVTPGTTVEFSIRFFNDVVAPISTAQIFLAEIVVVGNGVADLDSREVIILVPAGSGPLI